MHKVQIQNTPYEFNALPGESVLSAALRQGVDMPWGCGSGICGTCMGHIIKGRIDYPDGPPMALFEDDAGQGKGLFCVGHARCDLLLNIPEMNP